MASKVMVTHEFGQSVLNFVIAEAFQKLGYGSRSTVYSWKTSVFVMLPAPGDGEQKVFALCFTSISLRQASAWTCMLMSM